MTIKEIRKLTGLMQREFAEKYEIPLGTLKQWESKPTSSSFRTCPVYVNHLLERAVREDFSARRQNQCKISLPLSKTRLTNARFSATV